MEPIRKRYANKMIMQRADPMFDKELDEIIRERFAKGLDNRPVGRRVIQRKIIRTPWWINVKRDLKISKFLPEDDEQAGGFR